MNKPSAVVIAATVAENLIVRVIGAADLSTALSMAHRANLDEIECNLWRRDTWPKERLEDFTPEDIEHMYAQYADYIAVRHTAYTLESQDA